MRLAPGSTAWLLRHELRLAWRGSKLFKRGLVMVLLILVAAQALGLLFAAMIGGQLAAEPRLIGVATLVLALAAGAMLTQAITVAVEALYGRDDLLWLLSGPASVRRILAVRMIAGAASVSGGWLILVAPMANGLALLGHPRFLAAYAVFIPLTLLMTAAGFILAVILLALVGPRATRIITGTMGTLLGAVVLLAGQGRTLLGAGTYAAAMTELTPSAGQALHGLAWLPARALLGNPLPAVPGLVLAVAVFGLTAWALGRRFASGAVIATTETGRRGIARRAKAPAAFRGGRQLTLLRKEIRLLVRTPRLAGRILQQLIYVVPLATGLWRDLSNAAGLAALPVFMAAGLAWVFVAVTVGEDEAPDLAASAPVPPAAILRAKLLAAGLAAFALCALPVAGVMAWHLRLAPAALVGTAGAIVSAVLLGRRYPTRKRRDLGQGRRGFHLIDLVGTLNGIAWSVVALILVALSR
jgi:ABC-2 type transport system permease protein